jgi:hypothetical protein
VSIVIDVSFGWRRIADRSTGKREGSGDILGATTQMLTSEVRATRRFRMAKSFEAAIEC